MAAPVPFADTRLTRVLLQHGVAVDAADPRNHRVVATRGLATGALLLVEEPIVGPAAVLVAAVELDPALGRKLAPRDGGATVADKVARNAFLSRAGYGLLCGATSAFNHSCAANACTFELGTVGADGEMSRSFFGVVAIAPVRAGDEVCISYGAAAGHEHPMHAWACPCGKSRPERERAVERQSALGWDRAREAFPDFLAAVRAYLGGDRRVTEMAELMALGAFATPEFRDRGDAEEAWLETTRRLAPKCRAFMDKFASSLATKPRATFGVGGRVT